MTLKEQAIHLRLTQRLSLKEIRNITGAALSTLSGWLKPYPLTEEEKDKKQESHLQEITGKSTGKKKDRGEVSKYFNMVDINNLSSNQKGKIAELAVLFRFALNNIGTYVSYSDGDRIDIIAETKETKKLLKIQVRYATQSQEGLPFIRLIKCAGRHKNQRYTENDFDFIIGYNLYNDTAYIYTYDDLKDKKTVVSVSDEFAERWNLLQ